MRDWLYLWQQNQIITLHVFLQKFFRNWIFFNTLFLLILADETMHENNVQTFTGLPPKVDGQLRCYVKLSVSQLIWTIPNPPDICHVRVQWWGEEGQGSVFRYVIYIFICIMLFKLNLSFELYYLKSYHVRCTIHSVVTFF